MSSSEEENFDINVSDSDNESEGYAPRKKAVGDRTESMLTRPDLVPQAKPKAAAKPAKTSSKATAKAPAKPRATKKKVLKDIDENVEESFMDVDNDDESVPSTSKAPAAAALRRKDQSASELYQQVWAMIFACIRSVGSPMPLTADTNRACSQTTRFIYRKR